MKTSRKGRPRDCLCYDEYIRDGRDFQTIVDLKDSGLVIYHHEDRTGNVSDRPGGSKANKQKEVPESSDKPNNDVFIVHNTREEEIKPAELVQNLETNKITCRRCKTIYEHAQKLLQKVPILNKNNVMGICTHCYLKAQPVGPCRKCADIVKKFVATKGEASEDNKMRINTWLTKINRLLDDIVTDEVPRNLKSRANLEVYINDLRETPSQTTCDRSEVKRILKSKIPRNYQSHAQSEINFHDLLDTPSRTTYDRSEVKRPFKSQMHLSDTDITGSVSNIWTDMKSDVPSKSLKVKKEKPLEIGSVSNIWNEMKSNIPEKPLRAKKERPQEVGSVSNVWNDMKSDLPEKTMKAKKARPQEVGSVSNIWNEMKSDLPEQPLKAKKERPLEVKREQSLDVKKEKRLQVKNDKSLVAKSSNWKVAKYSIRYMQDKYDIRHFDENPTQRKKYCVAKLHGKSSHFKISHQKSVSDHHRLDKKIHFSKQTIDDSKHKVILKPSTLKLPKKFQSDETMIATISKATKKSSQKDLVYFFPKDIKKKELQPKSYVSSSTLIVETREKFKGENKTLKYEDDKNKFGEDNMFGRGNKIGLAARTSKKVNSLASTVTTKTKTDRDSRKGQDDKLRKTDKMMRDSDKQKIMKDGDKQNMLKGSDKQKIMKDSDKQKIMKDSDKQNIMKYSDKQKIPSDKTNEVITPSRELSNKPSKEINKDEDDLAKYEEAKRLRELRALQKEQELKAKADQKSKGKTDGSGAKEVKDPRKIELDINQIKTHISSGGLIIKTTNDVKKDIGPIPTIGSDVMLALNLHNRSIDDPYLSSNTELIGEDDTSELILGEKIFQHKPLMWDKISDAKNLPLLYQTLFEEESATDAVSGDIEQQETIATRPPTESKGIIRYALSDRAFIEKGWTKLPTEKIVRRMNVYRMRPAHPELNWFENNKNKQPVQYDTGETLATFDENGRGRWYYKNGRLALDYYDAEEVNAQQRFVVYSSGEPDEHGRKYPITVLAAFDYLGNGVVFDHTGKIRLNYNQTEGVVLDRGVGPVSHWKWHALNDPPVLQQVMIDTETHNKDPEILKLGLPTDNLARTDNEEMLAIEFENFVKEKQKKLAQEYKPFQIKMKALRINENFSLRVLDQATVYLIFRDGLTTFKLNLGMLLDHHEIVDTDTADLGEVKNNVERLPTRTDSLEGLRRSVIYAQRHERARTERDRRLRIPEPSSADRLIAGASRPLRCPFRTVSEKCYCSRKPSTHNMYYDTRII